MTSSKRPNGHTCAPAPAPARAMRATALGLALLALLIGGATQVAFAGSPEGAATASTHAAAAPRPVTSAADRAARLAAVRAAHRAARQAARRAAAKPKPRVTPKARHHHSSTVSTPATTVTAAAAPAPVKSTTTHHHHHATTSQTTEPTHVSGPTDWPELNAAIARIPTYRKGDARWVIQSGSHWGTADWYTQVIYVTRSIPVADLYSVAAHEWSHLLSVRDYDDDVNAAVAAMRKYFGGSGLLGAERAADCMAILQGATWTAYTSCTDSTWRAGARRLLNGKKLLV